MLELHGAMRLRRRLRPGRQPHPARRRSCRDPAGRAAGRAVHARHAAARVLLARRRVSESGEPPVRRYVERWGRPGDTALIAIQDFQRVGAAWYRLFPADNPGYGFVDEETPELSIAIVPSRRGSGLGSELLGRAAREGPRGGARRDQPERRGREPGDRPVRAARLRPRRRRRRRRDDEGRPDLTAPPQTHHARARNHFPRGLRPQAPAFETSREIVTSV